MIPLSLLAGLAFLASPPAAHAAKPALLSRCVAYHDMFKQDRCSAPRRVGSCEVSLDSQMRLEVRLSNGDAFLSAPLERAYEAQGTRTGWVMSFQVNFGGLNRGFAQVYANENREPFGLGRVEVYRNLDATGDVYDRIRCGR